MKTQEHPFSWSAILRLITVGIALYFVWKTINLLIVIIISVMLTTALYPIVMRMSKHMPVVLATLLTILLLLAPFIIIGITVIPSFVQQFPTLLTTLTTAIDNARFLPDSVQNIDLTRYTEIGERYILESTGWITNFITSLLLILFLTFFLIVDAQRIMHISLGLVAVKHRSRIKKLLVELAEINGQYIRGNLLISLFCGIFIFIGLQLLNLPFAIPLALFVAIADLLPLVGVTIGMIPAVIIGFSISPLMGVLVLLVFFIYSQIEGMLLAPVIYDKALNLSPALSFLSVLIGFALFGVPGAFLALPVAASLPAIISYIREDSEIPTEIKKRESSSSDK